MQFKKKEVWNSWGQISWQVLWAYGSCKYKKITSFIFEVEVYHLLHVKKRIQAYQHVLHFIQWYMKFYTIKDRSEGDKFSDSMGWWQLSCLWFKPGWCLTFLSLFLKERLENCRESQVDFWQTTAEGRLYSWNRNWKHIITIKMYDYKLFWGFVLYATGIQL